jgi:adenylate cyclase class 2
MAQETEIKLQVRDEKALRRRLKALGARPAFGGTGRVHEWNVIFDTPEGGLAKHGQLLRIRTEIPQGTKSKTRDAGKRIVLTFKAPAISEGQASETTGRVTRVSRHKVREELEVEVKDGVVLARIFEGLGMRGWFTYEKYRTTMKLPSSAKWAEHLLIEVDETPIGTFVELEGPPDAIDRAAENLGYSRRDYVVKSYLALYLEECRRRGEPPQDMVFAKKNARKA